jgi:all-trans-8'-apo-beta-carotenal 15,15'-oxygenase
MTEACFMWHSLNAHESSGELVADFVGYANPDHLIGADPPVIAVMTGRRGINKYPGELRRYRIDLGGKTIRQEILDRSNYEWPRINERHRGSRYRYGYLAKCRPGEFFWSIVTRVDMQWGKVESYEFGPGIYCSEAVFVPLPAYHYLPDSLEEPGWLLTECYNGRTKRSFLAILRAERLADGPVALVHLSHHVPFSFHGFWQEGG